MGCLEVVGSAERALESGTLGELLGLSASASSSAEQSLGCGVRKVKRENAQASIAWSQNQEAQGVHGGTRWSWQHGTHLKDEQDAGVTQHTLVGVVPRVA